MTMNTKGAVEGGAIGAVLGGLVGFFAEHAVAERGGVRVKKLAKKQIEWTAGGAAIGGAIGAYFGGSQTASSAAGGTTPSGGGGGTPAPGGSAADYWSSLSGGQQQTYKNALWNWIAAGHWDPSVQTISGSDASALNDAGNLALATDAFQTVWNNSNPNSPIGAAGAGVVDAPTYQAVTQ